MEALRLWSEKTESALEPDPQTDKIFFGAKFFYDSTLEGCIFVRHGVIKPIKVFLRHNLNLSHFRTRVKRKKNTMYYMTSHLIEAFS